MKTKWWLMIIILCMFIIHMSYNYYMYFTYVERSFVTLTDIKNFENKSSVHKDHYCYIKTLIHEEDKKKILNKFKFELFPINWKGNVVSDFIPKDENDFLYFLDDKGHGMYGYVLYFMSKRDNTLIVYQFFGD